MRMCANAVLTHTFDTMAALLGLVRRTMAESLAAAAVAAPRRCNLHVSAVSLSNVFTHVGQRPVTVAPLLARPAVAVAPAVRTMKVHSSVKRRCASCQVHRAVLMSAGARDIGCWRGAHSKVK